MKRVLSMLLAIVMVFGMLPVSAFAEETQTTPAKPTITLEADADLTAILEDKSDDPDTSIIGRTFTVSAYMSNHVPFASFTNQLAYNRKVIQPVGFVTEEDDEGDKVVVSEVFNPSKWTVTRNDGNAKITAVRSSGTDYTGTGSLLYTVEFKFIAENGELGLGLETVSADPTKPVFTFAAAGSDQTIEHTIDDSAVAGLTVGLIPLGAPFTTVTAYKGSENLGNVRVLAKGNLFVYPWGPDYPFEVPHYRAIVPAGTTEIRVTYPEPLDYFMQMQDSPEISGAYAGVDDEKSGMATLSYVYKDGDQTTTIIIPARFTTADFNDGANAETLSAVDYAVGPQDSYPNILDLFSMEYDGVVTYKVTLDEEIDSDIVKIGVYDANFEAELTAASAGEKVGVRIDKLDNQFTFENLTATCGEEEIQLSGEYPMFNFTMPEGDVKISAEIKQKTVTAYNIETTTSNGSITVYDEANNEITTCAAGGKFKVVASADPGYVLKTVAVLHGETELTPDVNGFYTMPQGNVSVSATFEKQNYNISKVVNDTTMGDVTWTIGDNKEAANMGDSVTLTVTPKIGYAVDTVAVTYMEGEEQKTVTLNENNAFTMPAADVTVSVTFKVHEHTYDKSVVQAKYLKSAATCEADAVYYKSCECTAFAQGEDAATFTVTGSKLGHNYVDGVCNRDGCGAADPDYTAPEAPAAPFTVTVDGKNIPVGTTTIDGAEEYYGIKVYYVSYPQGKDAVIQVLNGEILQSTIMGEPVIAYSGNTATVDWATNNSYGFFQSAAYFAEFTGKILSSDISESSLCTLVSLVDGKEAEYYLVIEATEESAGEEHTCDYQDVVHEDYLKTAATCQSPAVYYKSCSICGEMNENETFTSGNTGDHSIESKKCTVCGALDVNYLKWWYNVNGSSVEVTEITIKEGDTVDASTSCTPKASGIIGFSSADSTITSVPAEATADSNGHVTIQVIGKKIGQTVVTAFSKVDNTKKAELIVNVTCSHKNTETTTTYTQVEGSENHNAVVKCECGETISTTTGSCGDENTDGKCDLCGGDVTVPEVSGPYEIYNSGTHGNWGTITLSSLSIQGVTVKGYEWIEGTCIVTLAADTPASAEVTFVPTGVGSRGAFYVSGNKNTRTVTIENGAGEVKVGTAFSANYGAQKTEKTIKFQLEGTQKVPVESITILPENPVVKAGGNLQLSANVYPENATVKDVTWSTTAASTALSLDEKTGKVMGQTMGMGQYYTITATSKSNPEVSAKCTVFLDYKDEEGISIDANTMTIKVGQEGTLTATVEGDQLSCNKTVTWTSSDDTVASVNGGKVTGLKAGKATITATSYRGFTATCEVTVEATHICDYTQEIAADNYLKSAATCQSGAVYYKSCTCGLFDNSKAATFVSGDPVDHSYVDGVCQWCEKADPLADIQIDLGGTDGQQDLSGIALNLTSGSSMVLNLSFDAEEVKDMVTWVSSDEDVANVIYDEAVKIFKLVTGNAGTATVSVYDNNDLVAATADDEPAAPAPLATFTVTVEESPIEVEGYSITMDTDKPGQMVGEENIQVSLKVRHDKLSVYNSYKLELTYNDSVVKLVTVSRTPSDTTSAEEGFYVSDEYGDVTITRYGPALETGSDDIVLTFKAIDPGTADVKLTKAYISDSDAALTGNAPEAAIIDGNVEVTEGVTQIIVKNYEVHLDADFSSEQENVGADDDFCFTANDPFYNYTITATAGGVNISQYIKGSGTEADPYKIEAKYITGNLVVDSEKTGKQYNVSITGAMQPAEGYYTGENAAQYMTDYKAVLTGNNHTVAITIGGETYTGAVVEGNEYTIPGKDIKGDIAIDVTENAPVVGPHTVTITGSGSDDVVDGTAAPTVANNGTYTFHLKEAEGYEYAVQATVGGTGVPVTKAKDANDDLSYTYTIAGVTGNLNIVIEKSNLEVKLNPYVDLDKKTLYLVTATMTLPEGKSLSYDGSVMFYSEQYQAWAYLVTVNEGQTLAEADAKAKITVGDAAYTILRATLDVNKSGLEDINDAQLVYDMYNKKYQDITAAGMMEKFLLADTAQGESAKKLDVRDARAICDGILS